MRDALPWLSVLGTVLVGCSGSGGSAGSSPLAIASPLVAPSPSPIATTPAPTIASTIRHVVVIVQENRSFDNLFNGYPGADTVSVAPGSNGTSIPLHVMHLEDGVDVDHTHIGFETEYDSGRSDGFANVNLSTSPPYPNYAFSYVDPTETAPYRAMASQYALADRMFQSNSGPSYAAHQYLIAGQSADVAEVPSSAPWGCDAPATATTELVNAAGIEVAGPFPCFDYPTLADRLDAANTTWAYYTPGIDGNIGGKIWTAYDAIKHIRYSSTDWGNVRSPETTIFTDLSAGHLPAMSWVIPTIANSDHPQSNSATGPQWVASLVDAIGQSPDWNSTAIFVVWDDWGGWYDHVVPQQLDAMGLGYRVPLIAIGPYAKHGYVSHTQHEFGSILHFTEEAFGLPSLGQADARADDLADMFDFSQKPSAYHTLTSSAVRRSMSIAKPSAFMDY